MNWKEKLAQLRNGLPDKNSKRKRLTRKEVISQEIEEYTRVSDKIIRKRRKKVTK